jgi:hypothetical protein
MQNKTKTLPIEEDLSKWKKTLYPNSGSSRPELLNEEY